MNYDQELNLRLAFRQYTDAEGLIQPMPGQSSGNGLLFTGEYIMLLSKLGLLTIEDTRYFNAVISQCEVEPGLLRRHPVHYSNDQEGPDDLIGVAAGAAVTDPRIARRILGYGRTHFFYWGPFRFSYYFRNELPFVSTDPRAWLGRQPSTIAHVQFAAGEKPPLWRRLVWAVAVASVGYGKGPRENGGQDSWILSWLLVETYRAVTKVHNELVSIPCELACEVFDRRLAKVWPGGMGDVFAQYFGNKNHPLAAYFPKNEVVQSGGKNDGEWVREVSDKGLPGEDEQQEGVL